MISFHQVCTLSQSTEEDLRLAHRLGYDAIGLYRRKISDGDLDTIADQVRGSGLGVTSLSWAGGFTGSDGCTFEDSLEDARAAVVEASRLGASVLTLISGGLNSHIRRHARRMLCRALGSLAPLAERHGVTLGLEPIHPGCGPDWSFIQPLAAAVDVVREVAHPSVRLVVDLYHVGWCDPPPEMTRQAAEVAGLVQLGDGRATPDGEMNRCPLGWGAIPLERLVGDLRDGGYDGPWEVELVGQDVEQIEYDELLKHALGVTRDLLVA